MTTEFAAESGAQTMTPTVTLPEKIGDDFISGFKVWASIPANDDKGITIDNVREGDTVIVYDAAGIASFEKVNMALVKGIVGIANAAVGTALVLSQPETAPFVATWNAGVDAIMSAVPDELGDKRRDMYGRDPGTGDYAKNEGGLIVCMPESHGPLYATDDYHLTGDTKNDGRLYKYYSSDTKKMNAFFPCPIVNDPSNQSSSNNGRMQATATTDGAVHILAFDEKFTDNAGYYNVGLVVVRAAAASETTELVNVLVGGAPAGGI
ncbi:hypothetical protein [Arsenicibacter rosenii]|uniref:Uncharacterized protein n=1 Tax=Arsenicibacter rosenii TaxID=1750698 RepID=A0A1S2VKD3_9BACT|nr:hypothetical protein [Arsenicibacter rosenii]OIN59193.1 hypothetical protein BLX24_09365 [Arsenicibacter rosenii]